LDVERRGLVYLLLQRRLRGRRREQLPQGDAKVRHPTVRILL
jgi:hypothetical protein